MAEDDKGGGSEEKSNAPESLTVDVDGVATEFTPDKIANLVAQQASATQQSQSAAALTELATRYNMDVPTFAAQTEGALTVVGNLIEQGVIDEQGNPIGKGKMESSEESDDHLNLDGLTGESTDTKQLQAILGAVDKKMAPVVAALESIQASQTKLQTENTSLIRMRVQDQLQKKFPSLEEGDVSSILGKAASDRTKSVTAHAEEFVKDQERRTVSAREKYAKEFGINLAEFDENKLKQQDNSGPGTRFKGKTFSFKQGKKDGIDPREAAGKFLDGANYG